jgi:thymidylate synthase (FAD)
MLNGVPSPQVILINTLSKPCQINLYSELLEAGVAREQARMVLPLATTTKIHMTGSIRSWIHFLELRDDGHAQKEIQLVAKEIKHIFIQEFPIISKALGYE